jgi:hypothetical protein
VPVKTGLRKDTLVYMRELSGDRAGRIDEQRLYKIRSIGAKQATVDRVNKTTLVKESWRGQNIYLESQENAERRNRENAGRSWRIMHIWNWLQVFVPVGEAGWDADMNF